MHLRRSRALGLIAAVAVPRVAVAQTRTVMRLASAPDDDVTPVLYADRAGLFRAAGIAIEIQPLANGAAVTAAVAGGSIDLGKSSMMQIISAHARGIPLAIIAGSGIFNAEGSASGLLVLKESPIHAVRELNGKTVSVPALKDLQSVSTHAWIDANGGDSKTVKFVEAPVSMVASALDTHRVDAGATQNPIMAQALATGKYRSLGQPTEGIARHFLQSAWFGTTDYLEKNHDAVQRFARILRDAAAYCNTHHAETVEVLAKFSGIESATIATMARATYAEGLDTREIQPLIDAAARYDVMPKPFDARELISPYAPFVK